MGMAKVTRNYQATVPKDARMIYNIRIGDTLFFRPNEDELTVRKIEENVIKAAAGSWKMVKDSVKYVREMRAEYEKRAKRLGV